MSDLRGLRVMEPQAGALDFLLGETRTVEYPVINESDFKMKDLSFEAFTVLKEKDGEKYIMKSTEKRYVEVVDAPKVIYPGKTGIVKVKVSIPENYNEQVKKEDGEMVTAPFRIRLRLKGIEYIEEVA